ncbi:hypothetical protein Lal_00019994 [Lupinus albus]|nr:hypothetical protein Lal_00019994 [Lupinus albus]
MAEYMIVIQIYIRNRFNFGKSVQICGFRVRKQPRSGLSLIGADVSISIISEETVIVVGEVIEVRFNGVKGLVIEGRDRYALMASGEWISSVDVAVASEAERSSISLACDVSRSLFANITESDTWMTGGELVGGVDIGVACGAEEGGVRAAIEGGGGGFARIA